MKKDPRIVSDENSSVSHLVFNEKFEDFTNYIYPILHNVKRQHHVVRDMMIEDVLAQPALFNNAGKTRQLTRIYLADAGLQTLRCHLRFLVHPHRKLISLQQHRVASLHLDAVGGMVNAWIKRVKAAAETQKETAARKKEGAKG